MQKSLSWLFLLAPWLLRQAHNLPILHEAKDDSHLLVGLLKAGLDLLKVRNKNMLESHTTKGLIHVHTATAKETRR